MVARGLVLLGWFALTVQRMAFRRLCIECSLLACLRMLALQMSEMQRTIIPFHPRFPKARSPSWLDVCSFSSMHGIATLIFCTVVILLSVRYSSEKRLSCKCSSKSR